MQNNRKILTLHEVLNLDRRPTLQEMVDLYIEDYTKYLFEKGIIKYMPKNLQEYKPIIKESIGHCDILDYDYDIVMQLSDPKYDISIEDFDENLNDPEINRYSDVIEEGVVYYNNKEYRYFVVEGDFIYIYEEDLNGKKIIKDLSKIYH